MESRDDPPPPLSLLAALGLAFVVSACEDRRDTHPPDESRAASTDIAPAGDAGDASRPADAANPDGRCDHLQGEEQRTCMDRVDAARDASDVRQ